MKRALRLTIALLILAPAALAQKPTPIELGFKPERVYDFSGVDNVNVFNGNNIVTIPLGMRYPLSSTFSYGLTLIYNGKVWDHRRIQTYSEPGVDYWWAKPNLRSNAGVGWRLTLGRLLPPSGATVTYPDDARGNWVYEGPSGDEHAFLGNLYGGTTDDPSTTVQFTSDESRLRMVRLSAPIDTSRRIEFPDGQFHTFNFEHNGWRLKRMEDRFGNFVTITYSYDAQDRVNQWTLNDSAGRSHKVFFTNLAEMADTVDKGMNVYQIQLEGLADANGARREYQIDLHFVSASFPFSCYHDYFNPPFPGAPTSTSTTLPVLTGIDLPDGTTYGFTYQTTSEGCGSGLLKQMTLPTRGVIAYTYQLYTLNDGACVPTGPRNSTPGVATRTVDGNVTTYMLTRGPNVTPAHPGRPEPANCGVLLDGPIPPNESRRWHRTSILSPPDAAGSRTRSDHYFNMWTAAGGDEDPLLEAHNGVYFTFGKPLTAGWPGFARARLAPPGLELSGDVGAADEGILATTANRSLSSQLWSDCASDGSCNTLLRSSYRRYPNPGVLINVTEALSERTVFHDDNGCDGLCFVQTDQDSSTWDRVGHFRTSTMSSNFPGVNSQTATTNYVTWTDGALSDSAQPWVLERYTEKTRTIGGQTSRATFCFDPHGRLTRQRLLAGPVEQPSDLMTQYFWEGANVEVEWSFGGDGGTLGTQSDLCAVPFGTIGYRNDYTWQNGVLATAQYGPPIAFLSLDYTSDTTGLVTASRGSDGLATNYDYEVYGRLRQVTPPGETPTVYTFTSATANSSARVVARRNPDLLRTTDDVVLTYDYDNLGRVRRTERTLPGAGCVEQEVTYDALGRKSTESVWKSCGATGAVTQFRYDPLGRIDRITAPDGTQSSVTYTGTRLVRRTADVGGFPSVTEEEYDVFGRLVRVAEDVTGSPLITRYTYDVGDRLKTATILGTDGDQERVFTYDGRGLLTSEQHPELGDVGYGSTSYTYDSRGHVKRKVTGAFDLTYAYDAAERVMEIRETDGRLLEQYVYDAYPSAPPTPLTAGKLTAAVRYHYDSDLASASGLPVIHSFHYHADSGRLGLRYTTIGDLPGVPGVSFSSAQTYDSLGQIETIGYPCRTESCTGDERARTIINDYTNGSLSKVWDWASAITYHPSGAINTVTHGSGSTAIRESWTADPNGMGRPASIQAKNNGDTTLWSTGTYTYDGSGNITNIGATRYSYDRLQRLTGWTTALGTSTSSTSIGYDSFGNQLYSIQEGCGTGPDGHCWTSDILPRAMRGTTNHYADVSYDTAGNVVADDLRSFTYDRLGKVTRTVVQDRDLRFLYAPGGERVAAIERKTTPGGIVNQTTFTVRGFDNQLLSVFKTDANGVARWAEDIIWRGNAMLAQATAATGARHYALDHLGSPRLITTGNTALPVGTQSFAPFGEGGTSDGGALQFTAHERDAALFANGLVTLPDYMHARYYDMGTGRFLSVDPVLDVKKAVANPQSWNRYSYVENNPLNRIDLDGRCSVALMATAFYLCGTSDLIDYVAERGPQVMNALQSLTDPRAGGAEKAMAAGVIGIIGLEVGLNFVEPGERAVAEGATTLGYRSFTAFKRAMGSAGENKQWHHIVEQNTANRGSFGERALNNLVNLIKVDKEIHGKISAYYSRKIPGLTGDLTVRQWLSKKTFAEQYKFGIEVLRQFGVK